MIHRFHNTALPLLLPLLLAACAATRPAPPEIPVDTASVQPGETVTRGGKTTMQLLGTPLARSVILVDRQGTVRYIQVVPELSHLPDMATAFAMAAELAKEK